LDFIIPFLITSSNHSKSYSNFHYPHTVIVTKLKSVVFHKLICLFSCFSEFPIFPSSSPHPRLRPIPCAANARKEEEWWSKETNPITIIIIIIKSHRGSWDGVSEKKTMETKSPAKTTTKETAASTSLSSSSSIVTFPSSRVGVSGEATMGGLLNQVPMTLQTLILTSLLSLSELASYV
jgi:hypothetical protein